MAAPNLENLGQRLDRRVIQLEQELASYVGEVGESIVRVLVPATPVDTGLARGNWRSGTVEPIDVEIERLSPSGAIPIIEAKLVARRIVPGQSFFIANSAVHLPRLNEGYSRQAPAGFIEQSVDKGLALARAGRRKLLP